MRAFAKIVYIVTRHTELSLWYCFTSVLFKCHSPLSTQRRHLTYGGTPLPHPTVLCVLDPRFTFKVTTTTTHVARDTRFETVPHPITMRRPLVKYDWSYTI